LSNIIKLRDFVKSSRNSSDVLDECFVLYKNGNIKVKNTVKNILSDLNPKEEIVIRMYHGLDYTKQLNEEKIGIRLGVVKSQVERLYHTGISKLKSSSRIKILVDILEEIKHD